ncbi:MAG: glycosyltransferase involved in cell wall biosynthesis [Candidatus Aldehydirespiratoraceae bacterium]
MSAVGKTPPSVSVIMGVLNGEGLVTGAVESLVDQTFPPSEIVIVDDGSTDGTGDELDRLDKRFPGLLVVAKQPNTGVGAALNRAIGLASGDYLAVADCDDRYLPHRLEETVRLLEEHDADIAGGQVNMVLGRWLKFGRSSFPVEPEAMAERNERGFAPVPHTTMMLRRSSVERFGEYRNVMRAEDFELMRRWVANGARVVVSDKVLATHVLRREHLSVEQQFRWMVNTAYARTAAEFGDDDVPDFMSWFRSAPLKAAKREARRRVVRLSVRGILATTGLRR